MAWWIIVVTSIDGCTSVACDLMTLRKFNRYRDTPLPLNPSRVLTIYPIVVVPRSLGWAKSL